MKENPKQETDPYKSLNAKS